MKINSKTACFYRYKVICSTVASDIVPIKVVVAIHFHGLVFTFMRGPALVSDTVPVSGGVGCCRWSHEDRSYLGGTSIPLTAAALGGQCCTNLQSVSTYHSSLEKSYQNVKENSNYIQT